MSVACRKLVPAHSPQITAEDCEPTFFGEGHLAKDTEGFYRTRTHRAHQLFGTDDHLSCCPAGPGLGSLDPGWAQRSGTAGRSQAGEVRPLPALHQSRAVPGPRRPGQRRHQAATRLPPEPAARGILVPAPRRPELGCARPGALRKAAGHVAPRWRGAGRVRGERPGGGGAGGDAGAPVDGAEHVRLGAGGHPGVCGRVLARRCAPFASRFLSD